MAGKNTQELPGFKSTKSAPVLFRQDEWIPPSSASYLAQITNLLVYKNLKLPLRQIKGLRQSFKSSLPDNSTQQQGKRFDALLECDKEKMPNDT